MTIRCSWLALGADIADAEHPEIVVRLKKSE
jgi:hypothetical protein